MNITRHTLTALLVILPWLGGCAAPTALTVAALGGKVIGASVERGRMRSAPIAVDELLAQARGETAGAKPLQVALTFADGAFELDAGQRRLLASRIAALPIPDGWEADLLAGPVGTGPQRPDAQFLAHRRATQVGLLLPPQVRVRSVRLQATLKRDRVIVSLRRKEPDNA